MYYASEKLKAIRSRYKIGTEYANYRMDRHIHNMMPMNRLTKRQTITIPRISLFLSLSCRPCHTPQSRIIVLMHNQSVNVQCMSITSSVSIVFISVYGGALTGNREDWPFSLFRTKLGKYYENMKWMSQRRRMAQYVGFALMIYRWIEGESTQK